MVAMALRPVALHTAPDGFHRPTSTPPPLRLFISKPSWLIRTESNVRREVRKKPNPPCVVCRGSGRVDCYHCCGRGRSNHANMEMLPRGEWPKWCRICGGSGLGHCTRCLGTGEYRDIMGFHFMKMDNSYKRDHSEHQRHDSVCRSTIDNFIDGKQFEGD